MRTEAIFLQSGLLLGLATTLTLSPSCAFKKAVQPEPPLPPGSISLSWATEKGAPPRSLKRKLLLGSDSQSYATENPTTLPESVPDELVLELSFPSRFAAATPQGLAASLEKEGSGSGELKLVGAPRVSQANDLSTASLRLSGLHSAFAAEREERGVLTIHVSESAQVRLTLRTPPALIRTQAQTVESGDRIEDSEKAFSLQGRTYFLTALYPLTNLSDHAVEIRVPTHVRVDLHRKGQTHFLAARGDCQSQSWVEVHEETTPLSGLLLPLSSELPKEVTSLERDANALPVANVTLQPVGTANLGLYATEEDESGGGGPDDAFVPAVLAGRAALRAPKSVDAPDHCEAVCPHMRTGADEFSACWARFHIIFHADDAMIARCNECGQGNASACAACAFWETHVAAYAQAGPNCLFCGKLTPEASPYGEILRAKPEWQSKVVTAPFPVGEEDQEVWLSSDPSALPMAVRFADQSEDQDPERRSLPFLSPHLTLLKAEGSGK